MGTYPGHYDTKVSFMRGQSAATCIFSSPKLHSCHVHLIMVMPTSLALSGLLPCRASETTPIKFPIPVNTDPLDL
jgi:hypothetical protein